MNIRTARFLSRAAVSIFASAALLSCSSDSNESSISLNNGSLQVPLPQIIRTTQDIASARIQLEVSVDGAVKRTVTRTDSDTVQVPIQVPINQAVDLTLSWYALVGNTKVLLADSTTTLPAAESDSELAINSYTSSGDPRFDVDNDQRTNISEVRENRNPLSAVDYEVPFSTASFLPANLTITNEGTDSDTSGGPVETDQDSTFSVWHNGVDLNIYLCGQDQTLSESTSQYWHDDTVFVFIDGGNDDRTSYDGTDDYQLAFVRSTQELIVSKGSSNAGCPNGDCVTYSFFSNSTACEYELSVSFPLASMNISTEPGNTFGFDIEFTDDDDGGLRDESATWIGFNDSSDVDPSTFGTMQLTQ